MFAALKRPGISDQKKALFLALSGFLSQVLFGPSRQEHKRPNRGRKTPRKADFQEGRPDTVKPSFVTLRLRHPHLSLVNVDYS